MAACQSTITGLEKDRDHIAGLLAASQSARKDIADQLNGMQAELISLRHFVDNIMHEQQEKGKKLITEFERGAMDATLEGMQREVKNVILDMCDLLEHLGEKEQIRDNKQAEERAKQTAREMQREMDRKVHDERERQREIERERQLALEKEKEEERKKERELERERERQREEQMDMERGVWRQRDLQRDAEIANKKEQLCETLAILEDELRQITGFLHVYTMVCMYVCMICVCEGEREKFAWASTYPSACGKEI